MDKNALRACTTFNPSGMVKPFAGDGNRMYLPLDVGMAWFHHYLMERDTSGLIDDSELDYLAEANLLIGKASVFINGELVGKSCSGVAISNPTADIMSIGQGIASTAKWRALENAGFGYEDTREPHEFMVKQQDEVQQDDIRACSYDPIPDITFLPDGVGNPNPYLEVSFRVRWFHQWLRDNKATGYIDDSEVYYYPGPKLLIAKARVYINGKLVGTSCASKPFDPEHPDLYQYNPVSYACTQAKGRALINAGFGVLAMGKDDNLSETPLWDMANGQAVPVPPIPPLVKSSGPAPVPPAPPAATDGDKAKGVDDAAKKAPKQRGRKPKANPEMDASAEEPQDPGLPEMPRKEALAFVVPVGPHRGETVGEVLGRDRKTLAYYASENFVNAKYVDFKRAAIAALKGA